MTSSPASSTPDAELILKSLDVPTEGLTTEQMNQIVNSLRENAAMLNLLLSADSTKPFEDALVKSLGVTPEVAKSAVASLMGAISGLHYSLLLRIHTFLVSFSLDS